MTETAENYFDKYQDAIARAVSAERKLSAAEGLLRDIMAQHPDIVAAVFTRRAPCAVAEFAVDTVLEHKR